VLELAPFSQRKVRNASNAGYRIGFELHKTKAKVLENDLVLPIDMHGLPIKARRPSLPGSFERIRVSFDLMS